MILTSRFRSILALIVTATIVVVCTEETIVGEANIVRMGSIVRVSAAEENISQVWAYADPTDVKHIIVCGMLSFPRANAVYGYVYSSSDGGDTWNRALLDDATRWVSEESCTYGQHGQAYFVDGQSDTSTGQPKHAWGHLQVFTSQDHGMSWTSAGRRPFIDWTMSVVLPAEQQRSETLLVFGNKSSDGLGHFLERVPVALEATDGAQRFSPLVTPIGVSTPAGRFGAGSVLLPDHTALFPVETQDGRSNEKIELFAYRPVESSLQRRVVLREGVGRWMGLPSIAQDTGSRFHGRIYVAWSEKVPSGSDRELWLAISDDNGYHWSSRAIFSLQRPNSCASDWFSRGPDVRITVNRTGVMGVLFHEDGQHLRFSVSVDGGRTFQPSQLVAHESIGNLSVDSAVPFNEHWLAENWAMYQGKPPELIKTFLDQSHLGLSVRLSKPYGIGDLGLASDIDGIFHVFWTGLGSTDDHELKTRRIEAPLTVGATSSELIHVPAGRTCEADHPNLNVEEPTQGPPPQSLPGWKDVSAYLNLQIDKMAYSSESHVLTTSITLRNKSATSVHGPLLLAGLGLHSDFGTVRPLNATSTSKGQPVWDLSTMIPPSGLSPNAKSKPIRLRFRINSFHTAPTGDAVAMQLQVFGKN